MKKKIILCAALSLLALGVFGHANAAEPIENPANSVSISERSTTMSKKIIQTAGRDALGTFAPEFARYNDDVLFGEVWSDDTLSLRDRSLITVVTLIASGMTDSSLAYHIENAKKNGVTQEEMAAAITHVAFYAGWPKAWAAFRLAKDVYNKA